MMKILKANSGVSSKRFISVGGFLFVCFITLIDLFTNLTVSDYIFEGLVFIILGGLGSTAAESFGNKNKTSSFDSTTTTSTTTETPRDTV